MRPTCRAILLFLAIVASVPTADAAITFKISQLATSLDAGALSMVLADVNNDSRPDILGINGEANGFDVFLNNRSGGFSATPSFSIGLGEDAELVAIASGDFDRDGNLDVVVVDVGDEGQASFLFGDGTGNFGNQENVPVASESEPVAVVVADLNNDNIVDAAVLSDGEIYLIRSNGDRTFTPFSTPTVDTRDTGGFAIVSGLFDSNAFADLAVTDGQEPGNVSVLLGNGDGTFKTARPYTVGAAPQGIVVAKLNDDGLQDLAVVDFAESADLNVSLLYGNNDGTFKADERTDAGVSSIGVAAADFDQDGKVDLAVTNVQGGAGVAILRNNPGCDDCPQETCNCENGFELKEYVGFGDAGAVQAADLNNDGNPDVVVLGSEGTLGVFLNTTGQVVPTDTPSTPATPANTPTATVAPPTSTPQASFTATPTLIPTPVPMPYGVCNTPVGGRPVAVATGDFNRDGNTDIAFADAQNGHIDLLLSNITSAVMACEVLGLTRRSLKQCSSDPYRPCTNDSDCMPGSCVETQVTGPVALAAEDLNGDGNLDLAVVGSDGLSVFFGDGMGGFSAGPQKMKAGMAPHGIAIADLNRDGVPDIMVANQGSDNVSIFIGDKANPGSYQDACPIAVNRRATGIVTADLNRDGRADFAVFSDQTNDIAVFLQIVPTGTPTPGNFCPSGTNGFRSLTPIGLSGVPRALVVNQFNQADITPDFAVALSSGRGEVFLGDLADGNLAYNARPPFPVSTNSQPSAIGAGDINRDGRTDLVIADKKNNVVVIFLGQAEGTFQQLQSIKIGSEPVALAMTDIDGDGRPDTVVANQGDGSISILITSRAPPTPTAPPTNTAVPTATPTPTATAVFTSTATPTRTPTVTRTVAQTRTPTEVFTSAPATLKPGTVSLNGSCAIDRQAHQLDWNGAAVLALALCRWLNRRGRAVVSAAQSSEFH